MISDFGGTQGHARWYHRTSRCVRQASLLGEAKGASNRKVWMQDRLKELGEIFAVGVGGFSAMDNHCTCFCGSIRTSPRAGPMMKSRGVGAGSYRSRSIASAAACFRRLGLRAAQRWLAVDGSRVMQSMPTSRRDQPALGSRWGVQSSRRKRR